MPAADAAELLRRNASDPPVRDRPAVRFEDRTWTHGEYVAESARWANLFLSSRRPRQPLHVGVLLDNIPEYLFAFGGAALSGATIVGVNHTRAGAHLLHDIEHTDCQLLVTEPRHAELIDPIRDQLSIPVLTLGSTLDDALSTVSGVDPGTEPGPETIWGLIFTSGTSDAPKAVICSQRRVMVSGVRMGMIMGLGEDDIGYVAMPLFHANSVLVGWAPSLVLGASVGLARRFSASRWLSDIRAYGATYFNYVGKPLSYILSVPERPDDADNTLRVAFGNEGAPTVVEAFSRRFGVDVIDTFGATEGGVAVARTDDSPPASVGPAGAGVMVVDDDGTELARARFDHSGRLLDPESCIGEIVNTSGIGPFEGYYNNPGANARATRDGWYWTGDLGYIDEAGFLYFAGRTADWIRVDGENFPAGPIEVALSRHPDVAIAAVYGVPDATAGDQVMAALLLRDGAVFDPYAFARWVDEQGDLGPKWRPRYVRIATVLPTSPTNKVLTRTLIHEKFRPDRIGADPLWVRGPKDGAYRPFNAADAERVRAELDAAGRGRFWDL
jgi:fatty-acyl-CoA synthase